MYDDKGNLSRLDAEQIIRGGGSVSLNGRVYGTVEKLPGEADFAKGNPEAEEVARKSLESQRDALDKQLAALNAPAAVAARRPVGRPPNVPVVSEAASSIGRGT